jgi:hypothetical protein
LLTEVVSAKLGHSTVVREEKLGQTTMMAEGRKKKAD